VADPDEVAPGLVARLRAICLDLPEAYEEAAWVGSRWCVRKRNFAHVLLVEAGWPPAYARAVGSDGPVTVLTFRTPTPERYRAPHTPPGFFFPGWFADLAGLAIGPATDWEEVGELLVDSYCVVAPRRLAARVADQRRDHGGEG
jgi:hypothetical protein